MSNSVWSWDKILVVVLIGFLMMDMGTLIGSFYTMKFYNNVVLPVTKELTELRIENADLELLFVDTFEFWFDNGSAYCEFSKNNETKYFKLGGSYE